MERDKNLSVYKNMHTSKTVNETNPKRDEISGLTKVLIFILSVFIPVIGIAFYIVWRYDRPKDKIFPLMGAIVGFIPYLVFSIILLIPLIYYIFNL